MNNNLEPSSPSIPYSKSPVWNDMTRAAISTVSSTIATTPLFNLQNCFINGRSMQWGLRSLYIGNVSNLIAFTGNLGLSNISQGFLIRTGEKYDLKHRGIKEVVVPLTSGSVGACGALTGEIFMVVAKKTNWSFFRVIQEIIKQKKPSMLVIGASPTILRDSIAIGAALGPASKIKSYLKKQWNLDSTQAIIASSIFTGIATAVITQPFQVIRVVIQDSAVKEVKNQPHHFQLCPAKRLTATQAVTKLWKVNSWKSMFRGLTPRSLIGVVITGCQVVTDEYFPVQK